MSGVRLFWDKYHKIIGVVLLAVLGALLAAGVVTASQAELIGGAIAIATGATWLSARATVDPGNVPVLRPTELSDTAPKTVFIVFLSAAVLLAMAACASPEQKFLDVMQGAVVSVIKEIGDKGIGQYQASGQVIEPGYRIRLGMYAEGEGRMVGVAGQISAAGQGEFSKLTPEQEATVDRILRDTSYSNEQKRQMLMEVIRGVGHGIHDVGTYIDKNTDKVVGPPAPTTRVAP